MKMSLFQMIAILCILTIGFMTVGPFLPDTKAHFNWLDVETQYWMCVDAYDEVMEVCYAEEANWVTPNLPPPYAGLTNCELRVFIMGERCCMSDAVSNHVNNEHPEHFGWEVTCSYPESPSGGE